MTVFIDAGRGQAGHQAMPVDNSWYIEKTLQRANLKQESAYPVIAVCSVCHQRIRLARVTQMEWQHVLAGEEGRPAAEHLGRTA